jgi:predicted amidohydrolase
VTEEGPGRRFVSSRRAGIRMHTRDDTRAMSVALFQMTDYGEPEKNIARARDAIAECCADFFVLPEFFAFPGGDHRRAYSLEEAYALVGKPALEMLTEASAGFPGYLVGGTVLEKSSHGYHNTCFVLRRGELIARHHKINLTQGEVSMGLLPGTEAVTFDSEWGRIGLLVCLDVCGPVRDEIGPLCDIVFFPIGMSMPDHPELEGDPVSTDFAQRYGVTVVKVSRAGVFDGEPLVTPSSIVTPRGIEWLASDQGEDFAVVGLEGGRVVSHGVR